MVLTTYIILVLISPFIFNSIDTYDWKVVIVISFILYFIAYVQRIKGVLIVDNEIISWIINQGALLGTSQLSFIFGGVFYKYKVYSIIQQRISTNKYKNFICLTIIIGMIIFHGFIETLFIAVFTGIVFICVFNIMDKAKWIEKSLNFIATYSTNLWLIHMFVYITYLKEVVYYPRYSFLIFPWFLTICLILSIGIQSIYKFILDSILNKSKVKSKESIGLNQGKTSDINLNNDL